MKTRNIVLRKFDDPGHGWVRFPFARLEKLGIADKISHFSYVKGPNVFLEEDGDLSLLIDTLTARGYNVTIHDTHTNKRSKIRNYHNYFFKQNEIQQ